MRTKGHHTVENRDNDSCILIEAPFLSSDENQFLGKGYYFWDNNFEYAKYWGNIHYRGQYIVCEANLNFKGDNFLDLVGNREHIIFFKKLYGKFKKENLPIGQFIEFLKLKQLEDDYKGIFPFKAVRALDWSKNKSRIYKFANTKKGFTYLNPIFIICLYEKDPSVIKNFKIIFRKPTLKI